MENKYNIYLGRVQKTQLKKYIYYRREEDFDLFIKLINSDFNDKDNLKKIIDDRLVNEKADRDKDVNEFITNVKDAIERNDVQRTRDYLVFLYSRLISLDKNNLVSLSKLFNENKKYLKKELNKTDYSKLELFCSDTTKRKRKETIKLFNQKYMELLDKNDNYRNKQAIIYLNINQSLLNNFPDKKLFYNYLFETIKKAYDKVQNHKSLIIRIQNIIDKDKINIKWEVYAYLTLFAEKFIRLKYPSTFYKPVEICEDALTYKHNIKVNTKIKDLLKKYYSDQIDYQQLSEMGQFDNEDVRKTIDFYRESNGGFYFIDCFILKTNAIYPNSAEINFIKNQNEILLVLFKHKIDDRKIPLKFSCQKSVKNYQ